MADERPGDVESGAEDQTLEMEAVDPGPDGSDAVEATTGDADADAATPRPRSLRTALIGGSAALGVAAVAGGVAFWMLGDEPAGEAAPELSESAQPVGPRPVLEASLAGLRDGIDFAAELDVELPDVAAEAEEEAEGEGAAAPAHIGRIFPLEPFVVNITDRDRDRFLKLKTEIELSDDAVAPEMEQRLPQIRDLIISLLGSKSFDDVRSIEGKNFLREELLLRINSLLVSGKAEAIYFTEFVVQ